MRERIRLMVRDVQNWIYDSGGYFWFRGWSHKVARRDGNYTYRGVRWKWLVKFLRIVTGCKFQYWKDVAAW